MKIKKLTFESSDFPEVLRSIPTPPIVLYVAGDSLQNLLQSRRATIVGSRKVTAYGRSVTTRLAEELAREGVVIVSGLAYGVDSIAHIAALNAGGRCIAVLPAGLDAIYPRGHERLARRIVEQGGALLSEYPPGSTPYRGNFVARNRITAALGDTVIVTEAGHKSGTLHTARFALEQGKDVMAVPGNITSSTSAGTNALIKSGALPITAVADVLYSLGIHPSVQRTPKGDTPQEQTIIDLIAEGETDGNALLAASKLEVAVFNQHLTMLEITGRVRCLGANNWSLS